MRSFNLSKYILVVLVVGLFITPNLSCKKYLQLTPESSIGPNGVFSDLANATSAVFGVYNSLAGDNGYGQALSMYFPYDDDCVMGAASTPFPDGGRRSLAHYAVNSNNSVLAAPFEQLYTGIERANLCIYYIPKMSLYSSGDPGTQKTLRQLYAECLTLRAQFYLELIRNWGDVPVQFSPSFNQPTLFIGNVSRDSTYDHLLNDLQIAEGMLPWLPASGLTAERVTQGAARALRARIALYRAGYSLNSSGVMVQGSNPMTYYTIAMNECDTIIQSGQHSLNSSFQAVFKNAICAHQQDPAHEIIWEVGMGGGNGSSDSKLGYDNGPRLNTPTGSSTYLGLALLTMLPSYFYLFDSTDARRDVTIAAYDFAIGDSLEPSGSYELRDGKFRKDWITPSVLTSEGQYYGLDWPLIRYSDVLLMYAEASNAVTGSGAAGLSYYMQVAQRAHNGVSPTPPATDQADFFTAIVNERAREFGGEGIRKYDLIRWNLLATNLANSYNTMNAMYQDLAPWNLYPKDMFVAEPSYGSLTYGNSFYEPQSSSTAPAGYSTMKWMGTSNINSKILSYFYNTSYFKPSVSELLPYPAGIISTNPNIKQNYGY